MNCKNCHTELDESYSYCSSCGGKVIRRRLTLRNLFEHLSETFFNYDNKLLRTIIDLFKTPEKVITDYINGVRKRYVNPISFFGLSLTITGLSILIIKKFYLQYFDIMSWMANLEIFNNPGSQRALANYSTSDTMEYTSLILSAIIPMFALFSWLIFMEKKYNYTEHIIIYLYSISFISIWSVFIGQLVLLVMPAFYIGFILLTYPIMLLYHGFLLKRMFGLSFGQILLKTLTFLALFFLFYIGVGVLTFLIDLISGKMNLTDFAPEK